MDLYRCVSFPDKWEHCETLLQRCSCSGHDGLFPSRGSGGFLPTSASMKAGQAMMTYFSFTRTLERGQWKPHPRNPIVSDVTRARPAGNVFNENGKLYRPAQDCSIRYGYGIRIQEILEMSESEYVEREVEFIEPKWDKKIIATHTFSKAGRLVFSDALEERWTLFAECAEPRSAESVDLHGPPSTIRCDHCLASTSDGRPCPVMMRAPPAWLTALEFSFTNVIASPGLDFLNQPTPMQLQPDRCDGPAARIARCKTADSHSRPRLDPVAPIDCSTHVRTP